MVPHPASSDLVAACKSGNTGEVDLFLDVLPVDPSRKCFRALKEAVAAGHALVVAKLIRA